MEIELICSCIHEVLPGVTSKFTPIHVVSDVGQLEFTSLALEQSVTLKTHKNPPGKIEILQYNPHFKT